MTVARRGTGAGPGGTAGAPAATVGDRFQGKYSDPARTPLTCEITGANAEIVIDLGKGTVSAGS